MIHFPFIAGAYGLVLLSSLGLSLQLGLRLRKAKNRLSLLEQRRSQSAGTPS